VEEVEQAEVEANPAAAYQDVPGVQVAVVLAGRVDALDADGEGVEQVEPFEGAETAAGLPARDVDQRLALDEVADQAGRLGVADPDLFGVVVLDQDRAVAQALELPGVVAGRAVTRIAPWVEELRRTRDPGALLGDAIDLALPAGAQKLLDPVLPGEQFARFE
jgi:hypothetical protein